MVLVARLCFGELRVSVGCAKRSKHERTAQFGVAGGVGSIAHHLVIDLALALAIDLALALTVAFAIAFAIAIAIAIVIVPNPC